MLEGMKKPILTLDDFEEISRIRGARSTWTSTQPPYTGYAFDRRRAFRLARLGYLRVETFSEHVRGEPRFYWKVFYLTEKGHELLKNGLLGPQKSFSQEDFQKFGRKGGKKRAQNLSPRRRKQIARAAAQARWRNHGTE